MTEPATKEHLLEHGFWDYTCPAAGGMEAFGHDDYLLLLDDMAGAGMNSLAINVKWHSTGYRSCLPYLDQVPDNRVIASDNELLREVIAEAHRRGIKVWLHAFVVGYPVDKTLAPPASVFTEVGGYQLPAVTGRYATDHAEIVERAVEMCLELVELFPGLGGLGVEMEGGDEEQPHRIPLYEKWAEENGRRPWAELGHPYFAGKNLDVPEWRDYATQCRVQLLRAVEAAVRAKGFQGELSTICEVGRFNPNSMIYLVNLEEHLRQLPKWAGTFYQYEKWNRRYALMDFSIAYPREIGMKVFYLPRGVMTWGWGDYTAGEAVREGSMPLTLEESWTLDVEDVQLFQPHGLWWFGCGTVNEGAHVALSKIQAAGYRDGLEARRALLRKCAPLCRSG